MKKTLVMLSVAAALAAGFSSCKKDDPTRNDMIIGTWNLTEGTSVSNDTSIYVFTPEVTSDYSSYKNKTVITTTKVSCTSTGYTAVTTSNTSTIGSTVNGKSTTSYTFKEDGTYLLSTTSTEITTSTNPSSSSETKSGYWYWLNSTEDQKIIMVGGSQLVIKSLSGDQLITEQNTRNSSVENDPEYGSAYLSTTSTNSTKIARKYTHNTSTTSTMTYAKAE